jgi:hypothetical protein
MKITDIIITENIHGTVKPEHKAVQKSITVSRDDGGYDRVNYANRKWMATAMADGKDPSKPVDMDAYSWIEKYNSEHPYTEEEYNMFRQADATIPGDVKKIQPWSKSAEPEDTHKHSPHRNPGPVQLKSKKK